MPCIKEFLLAVKKRRHKVLEIYGEKTLPTCYGYQGKGCNSFDEIEKCAESYQCGLEGEKQYVKV